MVGRRAGTAYRETGPPAEEAAVPAPRAAQRPAPRSASRPDRRRPGAARAAARRRGNRLSVLSAALGLPLLGAVAGELTGSGGGPLFAVGAVLGSGLAAALCTRPGRWWVVTAAPPVVLAARAATAYLADRDAHQGKALASAAVRWVVEAFPVMGAAVATALLVVAVRAVLARRARPGRNAQQDRRATRRRSTGTPDPNPHPASTPPPSPTPRSHRG
ncbi:DUF6542 domain-containing protein [Kitasatospora sp. NPDC093806]|uniref:DUF6542 domain-containing protein n=1 Tax=Kitasatospora sp. NPDC093806 TaxID=3155075 RepID=UPI003418CB39